MKQFPHSSHLYGFSPVWTIQWLLSADLRRKFYHIYHIWMISPQCGFSDVPEGVKHEWRPVHICHNCEVSLLCNLRWTVKCWSTTEAFPTLLTSEWLLYSVDFLMNLQLWTVWIPCHTHHTYSVSLPRELSDECEVLSCNRSFFHTHNMYETSLLSVSVHEYQSWRDHQRVLYIHYTEKVSGQYELQIVWPGESCCWWNSEPFILESWHLVKSLAMCHQICQQESSSCDPASEIVSISLWIFSSVMTQNSEMWTTEGSLRCFQDFTFRKEYETWMNPENVPFVSCIVSHVLCFACQWKPSGGQGRSYPLLLSVTKPIGVRFLNRCKLNVKNLTWKIEN